MNLGPTVNSLSGDQRPSISADGLEPFFHSDRPGGYGADDLWVTTRATVHDNWGTAVNLGPTVSSPGWGCSAYISADGLVLFFTSGRHTNNCDLSMAKRASVSEPFGPPISFDAISTSHDEDWPSISTDGRTLFFQSDRPGGSGGCDFLI